MNTMVLFPSCVGTLEKPHRWVKYEAADGGCPICQVNDLFAELQSNAILKHAQITNEIARGAREFTHPPDVPYRPALVTSEQIANQVEKPTLREWCRAVVASYRNQKETAELHAAIAAGEKRHDAEVAILRRHFRKGGNTPPARSFFGLFRRRPRTLS